MSVIDEVKKVLSHALSLDSRDMTLNADTILLGNLPELDSMAVVNVITDLEEHFSIVVDDDEINADMFATLGSLAAYVERKLAE